MIVVLIRSLAKKVDKTALVAFSVATPESEKG